MPVFAVPDATEFLLPALVAEFDFQRFVRDAIQIANENFDANKSKPNSSGKSCSEIEIRPDRNSGAPAQNGSSILFQSAADGQ